MSEFATPQRATISGKENTNSIYRFDHVLNKVDANVSKPTGKIPLGLIYDSNRGMLQSGAQRILVKEKDTKPTKVSSVSRTNFMRPTEAFSNGHVSTPSSKRTAQKTFSASKNSTTPTSVTQVHSANGKHRVSNTPNRSTKSDNAPTPSTQHHDLTTPTRNKAHIQRSSSTPPSAKRPTGLQGQASRNNPPGSGVLTGYAAPKSHDSDSVSLRANVMQSPVRSGPSATILFSPSSRPADDIEHKAQRRAASAPRSRPHFDGVGSQHHVVHRLAFAMPGEHLSPSISDGRTSNPVIYDLRQQRPSESDKRTAKAAVLGGPSSSERAPRSLMIDHQNAATPQSVSRSAVHKAPIPTTPISASHSAKVHLFKNPAPSSLLVTTADMLSANKAAKKAVIASFKAAPAPHHHYSAATHSSTAAAVAVAPVLTTPSRKAKIPAVSVTPQQTVKTTPTVASGATSYSSGDKRSPVVVPPTPSTPLRTNPGVQSTPDRSHLPSTPLSASKNSTSSHQQQSHSGAKRLKKVGPARKVTISAASPTILNAGEIRRQRDQLPTSGFLRAAPLFDVDRVLDSIAASGSTHSHSAQESSRHKGTHNQRDEEQLLGGDIQEGMRRSMSFGSELSSVRGLGGGGAFGDSVQADISLADTINLSANTSMFDTFAARNSPSFDLLDTPDSSRLLEQRGSIGASNRDALARLTLEENLMDLSAVEDTSGLYSTGSSPALFSSSSFTPIPPAAWTHVDQRVVMQQQQSRKPARHHHNTATVTSRSTDLASFYAQYGSGQEGVQIAPQLTRAFSGGMPTPIERTGSQHYLMDMSLSSMPGLSRQSSQQDDFRSSADSEALLDRDSALDRGMLVGEDSVCAGLSVASSNASSHQLLNRAMTMSSAFEFSPRGSRPASAAANLSVISQLSCSFGMSAANTPRVRTGGALEASRCSFVSIYSCPSELNRGMVQDEVEDEEDEEEKEVEVCESEKNRSSSPQEGTVEHLVVDVQESYVARDTSAGFADMCEQSAISCWCGEDDAHGRNSTFGSASSMLMTGQQEQRLDALVGAAAISGMVNTTCIRVNMHDVHSLDSGYALVDDPMVEGRDEEQEGIALVLRNSVLFNDRSTSSAVDDPRSDEQQAGSSDDAVNLEESDSVSVAPDAAQDSGALLGEEEDEDEGAFMFARRGSGEQDDSVLCEEMDDESDVLTDNQFRDQSQSLRGFVAGNESAILPSAWGDSHFVGEESYAALLCSSPVQSLATGPPRLAVSDSFELLPRSASALPVPVTHVSSTPVTKSYLDFEQKNKFSGSAIKQQCHKSLFRSLSPVPACLDAPVNTSETEGSDVSSQPFVSTLPAMDRMTAPASESPSRLLQAVTISGSESLVSALNSSRFSSSSSSSRSSCTDELRRLNPRSHSSSEQWASAHYGHLHGGASCFLGGGGEEREEEGEESRTESRLLHTVRSSDAAQRQGDSFSFDGMSLLSDREDDACCPDPLFGLLHSRDAWAEEEEEKRDERDNEREDKLRR